MFQNEYLLAKLGVYTAENDRSFAEHFPKFGNYPTGRGQLEAGVPVPGSYDAAACAMQTAHTPDDRTAFVLRDRAKPAGISPVSFLTT